MIPQGLGLFMVMGAAFGAAVVRGATGFAQALVFLPMALFFSPPLVMVPVVLLLSVEVAIMFLTKYGRGQGWVAVRRAELLRPTSLLLFLPSMALGATVLGAYPEDRIRQLIGLVVLLAVLAHIAADIWLLQARARLDHRGSRPHPLARLTTCVTSGITQGFAGIGGPPVVLYLLWRGVDPETFLLSFSVLFVVVDIFRFLDYGLRGYWTAGVFHLTLVLTPATLLGFLLGDWLRRRYLPPAVFRRAVLTVLVLVALRLMTGR